MQKTFFAVSSSSLSGMVAVVLFQSRACNFRSGSIGGKLVATSEAICSDVALDSTRDCGSLQRTGSERVRYSGVHTLIMVLRERCSSFVHSRLFSVCAVLHKICSCKMYLCSCKITYVQQKCLLLCSKQHISAPNSALSFWWN